MNRIDMTKHRAFAEMDVRALWFVIFRDEHGGRIAGIEVAEGYFRAVERAAAMNDERKVFLGSGEPIFEASSLPPTGQAGRTFSAVMSGATPGSAKSAVSRSKPMISTAGVGHLVLRRLG